MAWAISTATAPTLDTQANFVPWTWTNAALVYVSIMQIAETHWVHLPAYATVVLKVGSLKITRWLFGGGDDKVVTSLIENISAFMIVFECN